jgi:hypothetical protein
MDHEIDPRFDAIVKAVSANGSFSARMGSVIDECERQRPHPDWQKMRRIDFKADEPALENWLPQVIDGVGPTLQIRGLWFGLNNPVINGATTADIYIGASESYAADSLDWATELVELPRRAYLRSKVLGAIYSASYDPKAGLGNDAEYPLVLAYGSLCAMEVLERIPLAGSLRELKGAACGFDSGDALQLGQFSGGSFQRNVESA